METITRAYSTYAHARRAVTDLEAQGIPFSDISLVANQDVSKLHDDDGGNSNTAAGAGLGAVVGGSAGLLTGLGLLTIPGLGPVVAAGWLASAALGAVAGGTTGGILGALLGAGVSDELAHVYSEAVRRGGTLLSVKASQSQAANVRDVLDSHGPLDPEVEGAVYRLGGWTEFDPKSEPRDGIKTPPEGMGRLGH